jgi:radical SAM superfamily enzyme YgiQ (UPF0313 family)
VNVLLVSCYELGHQPLGIAWPRAFLERAGYTPEHLDLSVEPFDQAKAARAQFVAIAVPMHTALRLGVAAARRIRAVNPDAFICFHGLYAVLNAEYLLRTEAQAVLAGESESQLVLLVQQVERNGHGSVALAPALARLDFPVPSRAGLPALRRYVHFQRGQMRVPAGYVEASRGCLHLCLHCPIPPIYGGRFFAIARETVLADIRHLVASGAGHITFGDPDFLNGPGHALKLARALHDEFPEITFDFTAKVEHLLEHRELIPEFGALGCAFVVSAVESLSDTVLLNLAKGHTGADVRTALAILRSAGITLRPSFVSFTPWTTLRDYLEVLELVAAEQLVGDVDPVQLAIRLLIPPGSALLSSPAMRPYLDGLDEAGFTYRWVHPDRRMDELHKTVVALVADAARKSERAEITFARIRAAAYELAGETAPVWQNEPACIPGEAPRLTEPWFCCAEPTEAQLEKI